MQELDSHPKKRISSRTYHFDDLRILCELIGQRFSHHAVTQIFEEPEVFICQGSEAISLGSVFLHKVRYNIVLDLLLLNGGKYDKFLFSMFNLDLSLQQQSEKD